MSPPSPVICDTVDYILEVRCELLAFPPFPPSPSPIIYSTPMESPPCVHCAAPAPTRAEDVYNFNSFVNWEYDYNPSPEGRMHVQHGLAASTYPAMVSAHSL